jgi:hypothetical protein
MIARQTSATVHDAASRFSYVTSGLKFTIGRYLILTPDMAQLLWLHCQQGQGS